MKNEIFKSKIENLTIDYIEQSYQSFVKEVEYDSYLISYKYFIDHFNTEPLNDQTIVTGAFMIYGWMPTILKSFDYSKMTSSIEIFNKAKTKGVLSIDELETLSRCINNSIVGTSKLLHFINPSSFPILDSVIAKVIYPIKSPTITAEIYLTYQSVMKTLAISEIAVTLTKNVNSVLNKKSEGMHLRQVTSIRALEMILFYKGKSKKILDS